MDTFTTYWRSLSPQEKAELAKRCGTTKGHFQNVSYGLKSLSESFCVPIEAYSKGALKCETLRPDVAWRRVPDTSWPWHPEGRPLVDPAPNLAGTAPEPEAAHG